MTTALSLEEVKSRQQKTWSSGDYGKIAWITVPLGDALCEAADLRPGSAVLDVASGTGHVALAAARRFCAAKARACPARGRLRGYPQGHLGLTGADEPFADRSGASGIRGACCRTTHDRRRRHANTPPDTPCSRSRNPPTDVKSQPSVLHAGGLAKQKRTIRKRVGARRPRALTGRRTLSRCESALAGDSAEPSGWRCPVPGN